MRLLTRVTTPRSLLNATSPASTHNPCRLTHNHVCVIGSGPAGFYVAQHLLKLQPKARVDIYEKLPVPFGLVRYGVAPDHPEVKNVINSFNAVLTHERVNFVGNVDVGKDVGLDALRDHYNAIVLCYGATSDRLLNIENESLITSAREFVGWYNGLPSNSSLPVNLSTTNTAVIIGHGNVALDIARILLTDVKKLEGSDIADYALENLKTSGVKNVVIIGRRGLLHVAFTIKEFREMVKLERVTWDIQEDGVCGVNTDDLPRPRKRLTDLIINSSKKNTQPSPSSKHWSLKFLRSPVSVKKLDNGRLSLKLEINKLEGDKAVGTGVYEDLVCDVAFRSIGYKGVKVFKDLPFDEHLGVVKNQGGRVEKGVYCSGWAGQGPRGVILSTMQNAFDVAKLVSQDLNTDLSNSKVGFQGISKQLKNYTCYDDYKKIADWERNHGRKITKLDHMIRVCKGETL